MFRLLELHNNRVQTDHDDPVQHATLTLDSKHCSVAIQDVLKRAVSFDRQQRPPASEIFKVFEAELLSLQ